MLRAPLSSLQVIWSCAVKEIRSALTERATLVQSITLPVNYLIMLVLFVLAGGHDPVAVVMNDHGPAARQFVAAMASTDTYRLMVEPASKARAQWQAGTLVGVVTIPAGFDRAFAAGRRVAIPMRVNNLNQDLTDDAVRGAQDAITAFYARMRPQQVSIVTREQQEYPGNVGYVQFLAISVVVLALMVSGLLQAGTAAAREWETGTIKELLLAPARQWALLTGRMLGAFVISLPAALVVLTVVVVIVGDHPDNLLLAVAVSLLTLAVFVVAGTALGMAVKDRSTMVVLTRAIPLPLLFLSGVFGVIGFQRAAVQWIATALPMHWAIVLEQLAFKGFRTGTLSPSADALILGGFLLVFVCLAAAALRFSRRAVSPHA